MSAFMTPREAADYLGIKEVLLTNWRARKHGPPAIYISGSIENRGGGFYRYRKTDLDQWMDRHVYDPEATKGDVVDYMESNQRGEWRD